VYDKFFGNYLLNKGILSKEALQKSLKKQQNARVKMGMLAMKQGLITGSQVEEISLLQRKTDKKFGEIAVDKGYMSGAQVEALLKVQSEESNLLLGQAVVDLGYITYEQLEKELKLFEQECGLNKVQLAALQNGDIDSIVRQLLDFTDVYRPDIYQDYVVLFLKNMVRFLDQQPWLGMESLHEEAEMVMVSQYLAQDKPLFTAMFMSGECLNEVASSFAKIDIKGDRELAEASVAEFLNLHNGIFSVNMSNKGEKFDTKPPEVIWGKKLTDMGNYKISIQTGLGKITLMLGNN
jgi:hypothetical protein